MSQNFTITKFPVTFEGFGLANYTQFVATDGVAYSVDILFEGDLMCTLQDQGDGGGAFIVRETPVFTDYRVRKIYELMTRLNTDACKYMNISETVLYFCFLADKVPENTYECVECVTALFEMLFELNDAYKQRTGAITAEDTYLFVTYGDGGQLIDVNLKLQGNGKQVLCGYGCVKQDKRILQQVLVQYKGTVSYNYILPIKGRTRVLRLKYTDLQQGLKLASVLNQEVRKHFMK